MQPGIENNMSGNTLTERPAFRLSYGFDATRPPDALDIWDAGDDGYIIPPRQVHTTYRSRPTPRRCRSEGSTPTHLAPLARARLPAHAADSGDGPEVRRKG